jgi:hypothetical protein
MGETSFFWFFSAIFWLLVIYLIHPKSADKQWANQPSPIELSLFRRQLAIALCLPQLLFGIFDVLSGRPESILIGAPDWSNLFVICTWVVLLICWSLLLWWLWARDGGNYLARYTPFYNLPSNASLIRWFLTALTFISAISGISRLIK